MQKMIIRVMLGLRQRTSCREKFKKLQMLTAQSLYIREMMTFVIKNPDKYQTNLRVVWLCIFLMKIIWNANLMQQGNFIDVFLARHVSGTYAHHQEH